MLELNKIHQWDNMGLLKQLPDNSVDSIVTDPPYWLSFMGKKRDYDVPTTELWRECLRVLKPWGHLLAFAGTRTQHRMAVRIEDAGFEIRDMIAWVYGSWFPKSLNIGKAVDKLQGNERKIIGENQNVKGRNLREIDTLNVGAGAGNNTEITKGTSEWEGWGTALKPALEPITLARKPIEWTVAENVLKWGTGGINIDECRVDVNDNEKKHFEKEWDREQSMSAELGGVAMNKGLKAISLRDNVPSGRFPANLIHDGSDEVRECFPDTKTNSTGEKWIWWTNLMQWWDMPRNVSYGSDSGNASRFFKSIIYQAKASKSERNMGCEELEEKDSMKWAGGNEMKGLAGTYPDGTPRPKQSQQNNHPTVKPIALMEYLIKMVTKKWWIVLDPFMWSWTTGMAAKKNWYNFVGMEMDEWYCKIAEARINAVEEVKEKEVSLFNNLSGDE